jgi:hypothetical protein
MASRLLAADARLVLGMIRSWDLSSIANKALEEGIYTPDLAEVALTRDPIMSDIGPLWEKALKELGIARPSREQAEWIVVRDCMVRIVRGELDPGIGLNEVIDLHLGSSEFRIRERMAGEKLGTEGFIELYYRDEDPESSSWWSSLARPFGDSPKRQFDRTVVRLARAWLEQHPEESRE